ncbi:MAG TPA: ATP-binding cassette domain-containing protein, partial [Pseudomonadales bacterium]|nr:ATP-binding cassette domain-containing protein [Pseudomonadales bacterium]
MTSETVLKAINIHKHFRQGERDLHILRGVNLDVRRGERIAVVGLSGSGKSTLLHLLGGLDSTEEGSILVAGQDIATLDEVALGEMRNRHLGFVYQFHHLLSDFTAEENVAMPLLIGGTARVAAIDKAREILGAVGLS